MGLLEKAQREASQLARTHRRATRSSVIVSKSGIELMDKIPWMVRARVGRPAIRAAATVVRKEIRKNLRKTGPRNYSGDSVDPKGQPIGRSVITGTSEKQAKSVKAKRAGNKEMVRAIISRNWTKQGGNVVGSTTGPSWLYGRQAHILEFGAVIQLWGGKGKDGNLLTTRLPPRPFVRTAVQSTKSKQKAMMVSAMKDWKKRISSTAPSVVPEIDRGE